VIIVSARNKNTLAVTEKIVHNVDIVIVKTAHTAGMVIYLNTPKSFIMTVIAVVFKRPARMIVTHKTTVFVSVFDQIMPLLPQDCILSDIASVKTGFKEYYEATGRRYVSTHPMFGPTFANLGALSSENAIIISEGDYMGRIFFKDLYGKLGLNVFEYTFDEHDETMAYSLSIPFVSTFVFAAIMKHQDAPGTTFKRHMQIARGVLGEDDCLLREILFNPRTGGQVEKIRTELKELLEIIDQKDEDRLNGYLQKIRTNLK
jgi:prephenate dehydrogenase